MRHDLASIPEVLETRAGRTRLLSRLYRDIGLAAVAAELQLPAQEFDLEIGESIERAPPSPPTKPAVGASEGSGLGREIAGAGLDRFTDFEVEFLRRELQFG